MRLEERGGTYRNIRAASMERDACFAPLLPHEAENAPPRMQRSADSSSALSPVNSHSNSQ